MKAEIMKVKGGARAIATMTCDDGVYDTASALHSLLAEYDLCATIMVVPTRIMAEPPYDRGYCNIEQLKEMTRDGHLTIESHSYSHLYIAEAGHADYKPENCNDENRLRETRGSYEWLKAHFPSMHFTSHSVPGGNYDARAKEMMMQTFYSSRNGFVRAGEVQSLSPRDGLENGDWYKLAGIWMREREPEALSNYLDLCIEKGGWFISGCHNIVGKEIGKGNYDISIETLRGFLEYLSEKKRSGEVWVASFGEATRYLRECEAAEVREYTEDGVVKIELKMKSTTARGLPLSPEVFNIPLTVKAELPADWECIRYGDDARCADTFIEGGRKYAYLEIAPTDGVTAILNQKLD